MHFIYKAYEASWRQYPALFYSLSLLLGVFSALHFTYVLIAPIFCIIAFPLLISPKQGFSKFFIRFLLAYACTAVGFWQAHTITKTRPSLPPEGKEVKGELQISTITLKQSTFRKNWSLQGTLLYADVSGEKSDLLPVSLSVKYNPQYPLIKTDQTYYVEGTLLSFSPYRYILKTTDHEMWIPKKGLIGPDLTKWRFILKSKFKKWLYRHLHDLQSAHFLAGIATGEFDDVIMNFELSRFGLQHIMAISGFHFSLISLFFLFVLNLLFSRKIAACFLLIIVSSYFLFLGNSPSLFRAWISIVMIQVGMLIEKTPHPLNSLGIALGLNIMLNPLISLHLGFQFSFATTAAILMFYSIIEYYLQHLFPKRPVVQLQQMNSIHQHGYLLLAFFRQAFALGIAVNLVTLPLSLYYFHKFAWIGVIYNLFFPFLVSISMVLLLVGLSFSLIPFIGNFIHGINTLFTRCVLNFTSGAPPSLDFNWRVEEVPYEGLILYLSVLFLLGCLLKFHLETKGEELNSPVF